LSTTYNIYADLHLFGPYETEMPIINRGSKTIALGDIYELKSCRKKDVPKVVEARRNLLNLLGDRYLFGNHELAQGRINFIDYTNNTLFTHGDYVFWSDKKATKFRNGKNGSSTIKRFFLGIVHNKLRPLVPKWFLWPWEKKRAYIFAKKHNCTTIVCGHLHPLKTIDTTYKDVRVIVVPRGKTKILVFDRRR